IDSDFDKPNLRHVLSSLLGQGYRIDHRARNLFVPKQDARFSDLDLTVYEESSKKAAIALASKITSPDQHDDLICPISQELFRDPVIDNHGHTFEKESIEEHFRHKGRQECPLSRETITSLAPNLLAKSMVNDLKEKSHIPTCDCFEKDNQNFAHHLMEQGRLFEEAEEYEEALESYAKALKYTKKSDSYASIPRLFEKQRDCERAALGYLYLAKYRVREGKFEQAIKSLQKACTLVPDCIESTHPLARCYLQTNPKEAAPLFFKLGQHSLDKNHRERAIHYHECAVDADPDRPHSYEALADLYDRNSEKAHVYLRAALHFFSEDQKQAELFCKRACSLYPEDFNAYFPYVELLNKQKRITELVDLYKQLIALYEKRNAFQEVLECYKKLITIEEKPEYYKKITYLYLNQRQPEDALAWNLRWMNFHMGKEEWIEAEEVGNRALHLNDASIEILERLQTVYELANSDKLKPLLVRLGKAYEQKRQLVQAEKTYRIAWERFQDFKAYFSIAGILIHQDRRDEGLAVYKEIADHAYLEAEFSLVDRCYQAIKRIDPQLSSFSHHEKIAFATQRHVLHLNNQFRAEQEERAAAQEERIAAQQEEIRRLKERIEDSEKLPVIKEAKNKEIRAAEEARLQELRVIEEKRAQAIADARYEELRTGLSKIAFGKADWERYFGEVEEEPPLTDDIKKILQGPCPFWKGKRVEETHLLTFIPAMVNGIPLSLNYLEQLIRQPRGGGHATKYTSSNEVQKGYGHYRGPHRWVWMTKDILEGSKYWDFFEQKTLYSSCRGKYASPAWASALFFSYELPNVLEATVSILMHHAKTGKRLYVDNTLCHEQYDRDQRDSGHRRERMIVCVGWLNEDFNLGCSSYSYSRKNIGFGAAVRSGLFS
ncbi:MAG: U-box domain-containing protein, partial [Waddliaceae bacterium]